MRYTVTPRAIARARACTAKRGYASGFSLIELMVSVALGLMVLAALTMVFANTGRARAELERTSEQIDNGRYAVELISSDLQLAGFYGELNLANLNVPATLPDVCSVDPVVWRAALPLHVQGFDDSDGALPACMPASVKTATDVFALRRVRTCLASTAGCDPIVATEPYLQVALCGTTTAPYTLGVSNQTTFSLTLKDCATAASLRRYVVNVYFVSTNNGAGANVPTLKRLEFNGADFTEVPLVEGIEQMQIEYGLDTDGDGSPDAYTANPTTFSYSGCTTCTASVNWSNVVTAKIHLLARATDVSPGYVDTKTYQLGLDASGNAVSVGPFNDGFRRHVYTAAVRLMNPSGRREVP